MDSDTPVADEHTLSLGERITLSRKRAGLDQAELAVAVGVSRPTVSKWERDKGVPDVHEAHTIAELTRVSFGWLCGVPARSRCSGLPSVDGQLVLPHIILPSHLAVAV